MAGRLAWRTRDWGSALINSNHFEKQDRLCLFYFSCFLLFLTCLTSFFGISTPRLWTLTWGLLAPPGARHPACPPLVEGRSLRGLQNRLSWLTIGRFDQLDQPQTAKIGGRENQDDGKTEDWEVRRTKGLDD